MPRIAVADKEIIQNNTRKELLAAAVTEFATNGFAAANINRISLAAGFAKGTIYNYFPSKRDLMLALIDEIGTMHTDFIVDQVEAENQPEERLKKFFEAGFNFVETYPHQSQIAINAVYGFDPEFKERIYLAYQGLFTLLIDGIIGLGVSTHDFTPEDTDVAAAFLMSIYLGGSSLQGPDGRVWFDPEIATRFVIDGIRHRNGTA